MVDIKLTEQKVTAPKKTIKVKDVFIRDGILTDTEGNNILAQIAEELPKDVDTFSFSININLPTEEITE